MLNAAAVRERMRPGRDCGASPSALDENDCVARQKTADAGDQGINPFSERPDEHDSSHVIIADCTDQIDRLRFVKENAACTQNGIFLLR